MAIDLTPGQHTTIWVNQGDRPATVLAVLGQRALVEYTMPNRSTALRITSVTPVPSDRSVSYRDVPLKWLQAIVDAGQDWEGNPQGGRPVKSAELTLAERRAVKERQVRHATRGSDPDLAGPTGCGGSPAAGVDQAAPAAGGRAVRGHPADVVPGAAGAVGLARRLLARLKANGQGVR